MACVIYSDTHAYINRFMCCIVEACITTRWFHDLSTPTTLIAHMTRYMQVNRSEPRPDHVCDHIVTHVSDTHATTCRRKGREGCKSIVQ
jgi:hypothetical protein